MEKGLSKKRCVPQQKEVKEGRVCDIIGNKKRRDLKETRQDFDSAKQKKKRRAGHD